MISCSLKVIMMPSGWQRNICLDSISPFYLPPAALIYLCCSGGGSESFQLAHGALLGLQGESGPTVATMLGLRGSWHPQLTRKVASSSRAKSHGSHQELVAELQCQVWLATYGRGEDSTCKVATLQ